MDGHPTYHASAAMKLAIVELVRHVGYSFGDIEGINWIVLFRPVLE